MNAMRERTPMNNRNARSSLLGLPTEKPATPNVGEYQTQQLLEKQNDSKLEDLAKTVKNVLQISKDIETGINESSRILDGVDSEMTSVEAALRGAMKKLGDISKQGGHWHMCYLIAFMCFVFMLVYWIIR